MQHFRAPTRLLDWTESPLIGLYFAVSGYDEEDGALWVIDPYALNNDFIEKQVLLHHTDERVQDMLKGVIDPSKDNIDRIMAIYPDYLDLRMLVQHSQFTMHSCNDGTSMSLERKKYVFKLIVPKGRKKTLKRDLKWLGICPWTIFPDLEHLTEDLRH